MATTREREKERKRDGMEMGMGWIIKIQDRGIGFWGGRRPNFIKKGEFSSLNNEILVSSNFLVVLRGKWTK